jgi:hypothetical protein
MKTEEMEWKHHKLPEMVIEKIVIDYGPDGMEYLGFGEYYNHNARKFHRISLGAMMRFPIEKYDETSREYVK